MAKWQVLNAVNEKYLTPQYICCIQPLPVEYNNV